MPTELTLESVDLDVESLEPVPWQAGESTHPAYPAVRLKRSGRSAMLTFELIVLENPFLRVGVAPQLGGRILTFFDKRTQTEIFGGTQALALSDEGPRGVVMNSGIQWIVGPAERPNALGPIDFQLREAVDDDSEATLVLHELVHGSGLSWHATLSLPPDRAELRFAIQVLNRTRQLQTGLLGLSLCSLPRPGSQTGGWVTYDHEADRGLGIWASAGMMERSDYDSDLKRWRLWAFSDQPALWRPHQIAGYELTLVPYSGLGSLTVSSPEGALSLDRDRLRVQATAPHREQKFFLLTASGQTLEAPAEIYPERITEIALGNLDADPIGFQWRNAGGDVHLDWSADAPLRALLDDEALAPESVGDSVAFGPRDLAAREALRVLDDQPARAERLARIAAKDPGWAASMALIQAHLAIRGQRWSEAQTHLDRVLSTNAEDPLAWWLKALVSRLQGESLDDRPELLNAHYLAPLEPILRAESFLAQPSTQSAEPNALVKPLAQDPEALIEIACMLLDLQLWEEATRWIDEANRHATVPMLNYLQAWAFLRETRMEVEAVQWIQRTNSIEIASPYPHRPLERQVVRELAQRYPANDRLQKLAAILGPPSQP